MNTFYLYQVFCERSKELQRKKNNCKILTKLMFTIDSLNFTGSTSTSKELSITGYSLLFVSMKAVDGCGVPIVTKKQTNFEEEGEK